MANLLPRAERAPFSAIDEAQRARLVTRVRELSRVWTRPGGAGALEAASTRAVTDLESELEELDQAPSSGAALALIHAGDALRAPLVAPNASDPAAAEAAPGGTWLCYWPGRSLETGEAEIASRGFFDVRDRPPLGLWLDALSRPIESRPGEFEVAVLVWVPPGEQTRARAGRAVAPGGSLAFLEEVSPALAAQLGALVELPASRA